MSKKEFKSKNLSELLEENPMFEKILLNLGNGVYESQKLFLEGLHNLPPEEAESINQQIVKDGFPLNASSFWGEISGVTKVTNALMNKYARIIEVIAHKQLNSISTEEELNEVFSKENEAIAQNLTALFLQLFISNIDKELEGIIQDSYSLADAELSNKYILNTRDRHKKAVGQVTRQTGKRRKRAIDVRQGGYRERIGFKWSDENKITFYKTVENLPKIKGKSFWKYALELLVVEADFSRATIDFIKARPIYADIPNILFDEAVRTWRKYHNIESVRLIPAGEKPPAFEFKHALHLLNFPANNEYSTLRNYYFEGKKLSK